MNRITRVNANRRRGKQSTAVEQKITKEALAAQMGRKREAISRLLTSEEINPTLDTFIELLSALKLTADITLRRSKEGEGPIKIVTDPILTPSLPAHHQE